MCTTAAASGIFNQSRLRPHSSNTRKMLGKDLESREELQQEETLDLNERFEILCDLGGGAYGMVYKARDKGRGGEMVALKKVPVREDPDIGIPQFVMREVANLKRLSSPPDKREPHIVRLLDVQATEGRYERELIFFLVFEHMDQDLDHFIKKCPPPGMNEAIIKDYMSQILSGVDWMHVNNIVHRDLKPQNILVSRDGRRIKIADFGLSRLIGSNVVLSTQVVTQWYRAPEVLLHSSYSKAVDIWSVGCIFAEMIRGSGCIFHAFFAAYPDDHSMLTTYLRFHYMVGSSDNFVSWKQPLFAARRQGEKPQLEEIFSVIGTPSKKDWPLESAITPDQFVPFLPKPWLQLLPDACEQAQKLLTRMLQFQASERITAEGALQDDFFKEEGSEGYHSPSSSSANCSDNSSLFNSSSDSGIQES